MTNQQSSGEQWFDTSDKLYSGKEDGTLWLVSLVPVVELLVKVSRLELLVKVSRLELVILVWNCPTLLLLGTVPREQTLHGGGMRTDPSSSVALVIAGLISLVHQLLSLLADDMNIDSSSIFSLTWLTNQLPDKFFSFTWLTNQLPDQFFQFNKFSIASNNASFKSEKFHFSEKSFLS